MIYNTNSGNVGIGTTSPQALLDLGAAGGVKTLFYGGTGNTGYFWGTGTNLGQSANEASIFIGGATGACCGSENFAIVSANQSSWPYSSYTTRFVVNSQTGYAGLGTTSPRTKLDIWGGLLSVTGTDQNGTVVVGSQSGYSYVGCNTLTNGIAISPAGTVGIGTSNIYNYSLAVNGSAMFTSAFVKPYANWPDYVFKKGYRLPPLDSLSNYIQANHHLPDIPSADSIQKTGLDLGGNQAALLKKIEELTLYLIEDDKQKQAQNQQLEEQGRALKALQEKIERLERLIAPKIKN